jgi:hypothetical protein
MVIAFGTRASRVLMLLAVASFATANPHAFAQHIHFQVPAPGSGGLRDLDARDFQASKEEIRVCIYSGQAQWLEKQQDEMSHLHRLPKLGAVVLLNHEVSSDELKYVASLKNVERVWVGDAPEGVSVAAEALTAFAEMRQLRDLQLCIHGLDKSHMRFLAECRALSGLTIQRASEWQWVHGKSPDGVIRLGELTDSCGDHIAAVKTLDTLDVLGNRWLTDDFVEKISGLPKLRTLSIDSSLLTDDALRIIAENMQLESLAISSPLLTDAGVKKWLGRAGTLRNLEIDSPQLTDIAFDVLKPLSLQSLVINNCQSKRAQDEGKGPQSGEGER